MAASFSPMKLHTTHRPSLRSTLPQPRCRAVCRDLDTELCVFLNDRVPSCAARASRSRSVSPASRSRSTSPMRPRSSSPAARVVKLSPTMAPMTPMTSQPTRSPWPVRAVRSLSDSIHALWVGREGLRMQGKDGVRSVVTASMASSEREDDWVVASEELDRLGGGFVDKEEGWRYVGIKI